jgi:hypothetical protein
LLKAIRAGDYDEDLDSLSQKVFNALKARRAVVAREAADEFEIGDHVEVTGYIKPRWMIGQTGVIDEFEDTRIWIKLDETAVRQGTRRTRHIDRIGITANHITKLED